MILRGVSGFSTRGRRALQNDVLIAASQVFHEGATDLTNVDPSPYEDKIDSMQRFKQVCEDLHRAGVDAYILYRILSGYCHPSATVADQYIGQHTNGSLVKHPKGKTTFDSDLLYFLLSASLVWAGRAFSYLSDSKPHRSALRSAARRLGITAEIKLSEKYYQRHAAATKRS